MGGSPLAEDRMASAHRELREETGLSAARLTEIMKVHTSNSITDEVGYIYLAEELTPGEQALEQTENITTRRLPLADALAMAHNGEITDAMSCLALMRIAQLREESR